MKNIVLATLLCLFYTIAAAQPGWTYLQGDRNSPLFGNYGIKGLAYPANRPGVRTGEISWQDKSGNIWIFGGNGNAAGGSGYLNDLWRYSPTTDIWTWMSGDPIENQFGIFGKKGVASSLNKVMARSNAAHWIDASGDLWLFGGKGSDNAVQSILPFIFNDTWKYNIATGMWTWMGGDTVYKKVIDYIGVYGIKGTGNSTTKPSSRFDANTWTDADGNTWIYGGEGRDYVTRGILSDLWKYSPESDVWTWISGDTVVNQAAIHGTIGIATSSNTPGSKAAATSWKDITGNFFLFGGKIINGSFNPAIFSNDLWMYSINTGLWTWVGGDAYFNPFNNAVYGIKGTPSAANKPGSRSGAAGAIDTSGNLLLYGGGTGSTPTFNDLWKYDPVIKQWTWISGDANVGNRLAVYGEKGTPSDTTKPAGGIFSTAWTDNSGNFWLGAAEPIFRYSLSSNKWTWIRGDTVTTQYYLPAYGSKGNASNANTPGPRQKGAAWTDSNGDLWLFGGYNFYRSGLNAYGVALNDLWKYATLNNLWTWMGGDSSINNKHSYGIKGVAASSNQPTVRQKAITWKDNNGDFWLFGGIASPLQSSGFADLWRFSPKTGLWTWISGDSSNIGTGVYGTLGVAAPANKPGTRSDGTGWTDNKGNLWMFGGAGPMGNYNDLWKYNISTDLWTWVAGDNRISIGIGPYLNPNYGQKGVSSNGNPGGRYGSLGWTDSSGNFWLFGGSANLYNGSHSYNDLWEYSPATGWIWVSGDNFADQPGMYGSPGVATTTNKPGARNGALAWTDASNSLYFFGGNVDTTTFSSNNPSSYKYFNDVWRYVISTGLWTWISGDTTINYPGYYGTKGIASSSNKPGARTGVMGWTDVSGKQWMYGGFGYPESGMRYLNDLFVYIPQLALPVVFNNFTVRQQGQSVIVEWSTAEEQSSSIFTIERSPGGASYTQIGTVPAKGVSNFTSLYTFTDKAPFQGSNFYRIKEINLDGNGTYSSIKKISFDPYVPKLDVINPVINNLEIRLQLPSDQKIIVQVSVTNGQLLFEKEYLAARGSSVFLIPVTQLSRGNYIVTVQSPVLNETRSFIKQ
jgi:hypothetical protein